MQLGAKIETVEFERAKISSAIITQIKPYSDELVEAPPEAIEFTVAVAAAKVATASLSAATAELKEGSGSAAKLLADAKKLQATVVELNARAAVVEESVQAVNNNPSDREIVMAAVQKHGYALQFADAALRADKDVVVAAVKENGTALQYAV